MKKLLNGILMDMTAEEISEKQAKETIWDNSALDRALNNLRFERNLLLAKTDYLANSDVTMSSAMTTYRQNLRDLTNGLDTVAKVNAKEFPTKPEDN